MTMWTKTFLAVFLLLISCFAASQDRYPEKPVRFIVPFPPGGGTDALARILSAKLGELWGQQVIVENRAGAQGNIGTAAGAKAPPDGYTMTFAHQGALVINPHLYRDTGYDALKDFAPVARATQMAFVAVAHPSVPASDLRQLAQYAKQNPGKLTFASTSAGPHVVGELFKLATGTDLVHVPYKGAPPAMQDLLAGQVASNLSVFSNAVPHVQVGKLRALATTAERRSTMLPDVPTFREAGYAALEAVEMFGVLLPAKTPDAVADALASSVHAALKTDEVKSSLARLSFDIAASSRAEYAELIALDSQRWRSAIQASAVSCSMRTMSPNGSASKVN